jgi:hypothetical protein
LRPPVVASFTFGTVVACAAALVGVLAYLNNPGDNYYLLGHDELQHRAFADILLGNETQGLFLNALRGAELTGDTSWGTGFVIALSEYLFGTKLAFIGLKCGLHLLAASWLYELLKKYRCERLALYASFFFLVYPPLLVYEASFLKDDLVASLTVIAAALIDRKRYVFAFVLLGLLIAVRANSVLFPIILLGYLRRATLKQMLLVSVIPIAGAALIISQGYFAKLQELFGLSPLTVIFYTLKYLIGPLPTNILNYDTEQVYIFPWYVFSFSIVLASFLHSGLYSSIYRNWLWILMLLAAALGPYLPYVDEADVVGPRQFTSIGWFFFILFYERLLVRYRFVLRPDVPITEKWSQAY